MLCCAIIAFAAMPAAFGCTALPSGEASTNAPPVACEGRAAPRAAMSSAGGTKAAPPVATNDVPTKIWYPDVAAENFVLEDWAEEVAESAKQGLHIRNGRIVVLVRFEFDENEYSALTKLRAKFQAIQYIRQTCPDAPEEISAPCRMLVSNTTDDGRFKVVVMSFVLADLPFVKP